MTYGALNVFIDDLGLLFAEAPYANLSVKTIVSKLTPRDQRHQLGGKYEDYHNRFQWSRFHRHMGPDDLSAVFAGLNDKVEGLDLRRFQFE
jgi:hypothetical protein